MPGLTTRWPAAASVPKDDHASCATRVAFDSGSQVDAVANEQRRSVFYIDTRVARAGQARLASIEVEVSVRAQLVAFVGYRLAQRFDQLQSVRPK